MNCTLLIECIFSKLISEKGLKQEKVGRMEELIRQEAEKIVLHH